MTVKRIVAIIGAAVLLGACGGGGDDNAATIADKLMSEADKQGLKANKDCVSELAGSFSDADQELLVANIDNDDFDLGQLSADGQATARGLIGCVDSDQLVDMMMDQLGEAPGVDQDCVRAGLTEIGPERLAEIVQGGFSDVTDLQATMMACAGGG